MRSFALELLGFSVAGRFRAAGQPKSPSFLICPDFDSEHRVRYEGAESRRCPPAQWELRMDAGERSKQRIAPLVERVYWLTVFCDPEAVSPLELHCYQSISP